MKKDINSMFNTIKWLCVVMVLMNIVWGIFVMSQHNTINFYKHKTRKNHELDSVKYQSMVDSVVKVYEANYGHSLILKTK